MLFLYLSMLETEEERDKLTEIYNQYVKLMLKRANQYTANCDDADDIVHDVFLDIIKHKDALFDLPCRNLRRYIVIMVRNRCIDWLRKTGRLDLEQIDDFVDILESDEPDASDIIISQERLEQMTAALDEIDEASRTILEMKYIMGLSYKEIAERLDISVKCVDTRLVRAKQRIKIKLEGDGANG